MKTCTRCKIEKPRASFHRRVASKDGLTPLCKSCAKAYYGVYYPKHRAAIIEQHREYQQTPAGKEAHRRGSAKYDKTPVGRGVQRKASTKQRMKFPEKRKAYDTLRHAVDRGKIIKQPCACGCKEVEAHHPDYKKPLDVIWLCIKCHHKLHFLGDWDE